MKVSGRLLILFALLFPLAVSADSGDSAQERGQNGKAKNNSGYELSFSPGRRGVDFTRRVPERRDESIKVIPLDSEGEAGEVRNMSVKQVQDSTNQVIEIKVSFDGGEGRAGLRVGEEGVLRISPSGEMKAVRLAGDMSFGFVPGFFLEDIIYDPRRGGEHDVFHAPSEGVAGGFMKGGGGILLAAWPEGSQSVKFPVAEKEGGDYISSIDISLDGKELYTGLLAEEDLWHRIKITEEFMGAEKKIPWERPFEAVWRTQLIWEGNECFFLFTEGRLEYFRWRSTYPVWFEDGEAFIYLREGRAKILPASVATIIYPFEYHADSLMGFLNRTPLGDRFNELLKAEHPYRGDREVGFLSCHGTRVLRNTLIPAGIQDREEKFLREWVDYVLGANRRTHEHRRKYGELIDTIRLELGSRLEEEDDPRAVEFLAGMVETSEKMREEYAAMVAADGIDDVADGLDSCEAYIDYGEELGERMKEIITVPGNEYEAELDFIIREFNRIIWHAREFAAGHYGGGLGHQMRNWALEAGQTAKTGSACAGYAEDIRGRIRRFLAERTGYETTLAGPRINTTLE